MKINEKMMKILSGWDGDVHFGAEVNEAEELAAYRSLGTVEDLSKLVQAQQDNEPLCKEDENFIQTKYGYCFYAMGPRPIIYNLYVHPQYRRRGCSKALLEIAMCEIWKGEYKGEIHIQAEPREGSISRDDLMEYYDRMGLVVCDRCKPELEGGKR